MSGYSIVWVKVRVMVSGESELPGLLLGLSVE